MLHVTMTILHCCVHVPLHSVPIETSNVLSSDGQIDRGTFLGYWKAVNDSLEVYSVINDAPQLDLKVSYQLQTVLQTIVEDVIISACKPRL
jgi:hypothetical protein